MWDISPPNRTNGKRQCHHPPRLGDLLRSHERQAPRLRRGQRPRLFEPAGRPLSGRRILRLPSSPSFHGSLREKKRHGNLSVLLTSWPAKSVSRIAQVGREGPGFQGFSQSTTSGLVQCRQCEVAGCHDANPSKPRDRDDGEVPTELVWLWSLGHPLADVDRAPGVEVHDRGAGCTWHRGTGPRRAPDFTRGPTLPWVDVAKGMVL